MSQLEPQIRNVGDIFGDDQYVIPIYQRAYAWGQDQIATLLRDVHDYRVQGARSYYIGSLVTHARSNPAVDGITYEVVDGQQRLTTLYIALATLSDLGNELKDTLIFEGRARSSADLALLARRGRTCSVDDLQESGIKVGVETVRSARQAGEFDEDDLSYLLKNVRIVRTTLPATTDLNHYFEVMNSRGEQLEKHEIVKASLMAKLSDLDDHGVSSHALARIWDACSDMSRHVVANFDTKSRSKLFGPAWDRFTPRSFKSVVDALGISGPGESTRAATLGSILRGPDHVTASSVTDDTDETDRYGAIIDFSNFLLHVLALSVQNRTPFTWSSQTQFPLDDKQLVTTFEDAITTADDVKRFAFNLLRIRYLFDRYVIKTDRSRESEDDSNWALHRVRRLPSGKLSPVSTFVSESNDDESATSEAHEHVVMLQSMFQVTDSRRSYKNFLYAILDFLHEGHDDVEAPDLIAFLQDLAAKRYATNIRAGDLNLGTSVPHFAFNYLDYLLWRGFTEGHLRVDTSYADVSYKTYRFRYRSSVEHFYPQNPDPAGNIEKLPSDIVDRLGNLCLMSRSQNSKRSNLTPEAKIRQYRSEQQSLKFQIMASVTRAGTWDVAEIDHHGAKMIDYLTSGSLSPSKSLALDGSQQA